MNWFLILLIMLMFAGGYYAFQNFEDQLAGDRTVINYQQKKIDSAQSVKNKVSDQTVELQRAVAAEQAKEAALKKQVQDAQADEAALKAKIADLTPKAGSTGPAPAPPPPQGIPSKLGTLRTIGGKTYANCQLLHVQTDGIVVNFDDGITKLLFAILPPSLQQEFGVDPKVGTLTDAQVADLEQQRAASAAAGR